MEGKFYYTQSELQLILDRLLETCWMYSHCKSEEERKFLKDSIISNFKMEHPEFGTRTEADDEAMKVRYEALKAEEDARRLTENARVLLAQREAHMTHLREIVSKGYHPEFYGKFSQFIEKSNTYEYKQFARMQKYILYCNPNSFIDFLYEAHELPKLTAGDVISINDGSNRPIYIVLRYTPILQLFNMERNLENTKEEYIYGMVIDAPEGVPFPINSRIIVQTKNIRRMEGKILDPQPSQTEETCVLDIA